MKISELDKQMDAEGYWPGYPESAEAQESDIEACNDGKCNGCGWKGLLYRPYVHPTKPYRAFAICPTCGYVKEF